MEEPHLILDKVNAVNTTVFSNRHIIFYKTANIKYDVGVSNLFIKCMCLCKYEKSKTF